MGESLEVRCGGWVWMLPYPSWLGLSQALLCLATSLWPALPSSLGQHPSLWVSADSLSRNPSPSVLGLPWLFIRADPGKLQWGRGACGTWYLDPGWLRPQQQVYQQVPVCSLLPQNPRETTYKPDLLTALHNRPHSSFSAGGPPTKKKAGQSAIGCA